MLNVSGNGVMTLVALCHGYVDFERVILEKRSDQVSRLQLGAFLLIDP